LGYNRRDTPTCLVPESDISRTVVNDRSELAVALQVAHQVLHSVDTVDEVDNTVLVVLLVERLPDIVDGLAENGGESYTHRGLPVSNHPRSPAAKLTWAKEYSW
jgi:hypothetical protein